MSDHAAHFRFLDALRLSGQVNMYGATPHIMEQFGVSQKDALDILKMWIKTFGDDISVEDRVAKAEQITRPEPLLYINDAHGIYVPKVFVEKSKAENLKFEGVDDNVLAELLIGPDHEHYWDAWDEVCRNATVITQDGVTYSIFQDGDCWLIPSGMQWSVTEDKWVWA